MRTMLRCKAFDIVVIICLHASTGVTDIPSDPYMVSDKKRYSVGDNVCLRCLTRNRTRPLEFYDNRDNLSCKSDKFFDTVLYDHRIYSECKNTPTGAELCLQAIQLEDKGAWYCKVKDQPDRATVYIDVDNNKDHSTTMVKVTNTTNANRPTTVETTISASTSKPTTKLTNSANCVPIPVYVIYGSLVISSISILVVIVIVILCVIKKRTRTQKDDTYQTMGDRSVESMHYYDQVFNQPQLPIQTKKKRKQTLFDRLLDAFRKNLQFEIVNEYDEVGSLNKPAVVSPVPPELPKKREVNVNLIDESKEDNYLEPVVSPTLRNKYKIRMGKQPITKAQKTLSMPSCGSDSTVVQATVEARTFYGRSSLSESSSVKPKKNAEVGTHLLTRTISLPRKNSEIVI